jgi:hypothetical protein
MQCNAPATHVLPLLFRSMVRFRLWADSFCHVWHMHRATPVAARSMCYWTDSPSQPLQVKKTLTISLLNHCLLVPSVGNWSKGDEWNARKASSLSGSTIMILSRRIFRCQACDSNRRSTEPCRRRLKIWCWCWSALHSEPPSCGLHRWSPRLTHDAAPTTVHDCAMPVS